MSIVNQNSTDWYEWRKKGVGSSDVAAVLNLSPWKTRYQLWEEKTGKKEIYVSNKATERGHDLEPKARSLYELQKGLEAPATIIESDEFPYMRASLDGWAKKQNLIVEIKCPGKEAIELAAKGKAPIYYHIQIQYQLMLTGAKQCDYVVFDGKKIVIIPIKPDQKLQSEIYNEVQKFWEQVESNTPPSLSDKDYLEFKDKKALKRIDEFKYIDQQIKQLKVIQEELRSQIINHMEHPKMYGNGLKVFKVARKGAIDWRKATENLSIDAEKFRGKPSIAYQFKISDNNESV